MQKLNFMASIILMSDMIVEAGVIATTMEKSEGIQEGCKNSYDLINKSMKSFFKSNGESFNSATYNQKTVASARKTARPMDAKAHLAGLANSVLSELEKHTGPSVHHDTGKTWRKTKTDLKRFVSLKENMEVILKAVS